MINNRLFKKINSIFWCFITFLPIVVLILSLFKTEGFQFDTQYTPYNYIHDFMSGFNEVFSIAGDGFLYNPLSDLFDSFIYVIFADYTFGSTADVLANICSWVCWVQVMRLLVYVFYWFIDLISGLFDLMTFNRKGDN